MTQENATTLLQRFNETIRQWIACLDDYTLEMLHQQPAGNSWSLGQVYIHLLDDTGWFAGQMKAALADTENSTGEMHENARSIFRNNGFPDVLIQGPSTNIAMRQPKSKMELSQGLGSILADVNALYATVDASRSTGKTRHPGLLFFSSLEWLQFAEMHLRHHLRQKQRIDEQLFPGISSSRGMTIR